MASPNTAIFISLNDRSGRAGWRRSRLYRAAGCDQPGLRPVQVAHQGAGKSYCLDSLGLVVVGDLAMASWVAEHRHRARQ